MKNRKEIIRIRISHRFYAFLKRPRIYPTADGMEKPFTTFSIYSKSPEEWNDPTISKRFEPSIPPERRRDLDAFWMLKNREIYTFIIVSHE